MLWKVRIEHNILPELQSTTIFILEKISTLHTIHLHIVEPAKVGYAKSCYITIFIYMGCPSRLKNDCFLSNAFMTFRTFREHKNHYCLELRQ